MDKMEKKKADTIGIRKTNNKDYYYELFNKYKVFRQNYNKTLPVAAGGAILPALILLLVPPALSTTICNIEAGILFFSMISGVSLAVSYAYIKEKSKKTKLNKLDNFLIGLGESLIKMYDSIEKKFYQTVNEVAIARAKKNGVELDFNFCQDYPEYIKLKRAMIRLTSAKAGKDSTDYDLMINGEAVFPPFNNYDLTNVMEYINKGIELLDENDRQSFLRKNAEQMVEVEEEAKTKNSEKERVITRLITDMKLIALGKEKAKIDAAIEERIGMYVDATDKLADGEKKFVKRYVPVENNGVTQFNINN